ncbi:hypothetical protein HPB51_024855 [Rhipicephalus microplus]|uniref:G-protein coupled receptors family 1 profile domain-containing protein n=1 Tax=Rhipicephalus microplus TaxID=6941 RepID=A0A9J6F8X6_RHIMP|nr:hypothetical protein HPB51_024855 [Rhipicephalus microplus]
MSKEKSWCFGAAGGRPLVAHGGGGAGCSVCHHTAPCRTGQRPGDSDTGCQPAHAHSDQLVPSQPRRERPAPRRVLHALHSRWSPSARVRLWTALVQPHTLSAGDQCTYKYAAVSVCVSDWTLVAMSVERYYAICEPLRSRSWQTPRHAQRTVATVWTVSFLLMLPIALLSELRPIRDSHDHRCDPSCQICEKDRVTADKSFTVRFKKLYIVKQRQCDRLREQQRQSLFPPRGRLRERSTSRPGKRQQRRSRSSSRHRSPASSHPSSRSGSASKKPTNKVSWADRVRGLQPERPQEIENNNGSNNNNSQELERLKVLLRSSWSSGGLCCSARRFKTKNGLSSRPGGCTETRSPGKMKCREDWGDLLYERLFTLFLDVLLLVLPLLIMVTTYARIAATLRSAMQQQQQQQSEEATGSPKHNGSPLAAVHPAEREASPSLRMRRVATVRWHQRDSDRSLATKQRIIRMLFVVVVEFFVCWTPLYVLNTVSLFRPEAVYYGLGYRGICFLQLLAYASSCCNPITYCFMNRTFRVSFLSLCHRRKPKQGPGSVRSLTKKDGVYFLDREKN